MLSLRIKTSYKKLPYSRHTQTNIEGLYIRFVFCTALKSFAVFYIIKTIADFI